MAKKKPTDVQAFTDTINEYCRQNDIAFNLGPEMSPESLYPLLDEHKALQCFKEQISGINPTAELLFLFEVLLDYQCSGPVINPEVLHQNFVFIQSAVALLDKLKAE